MASEQAPPGLQSEFDLQTLNTLSVPARAEYFFAASSTEEISNALAWARSNKLSVVILGGGSNVVLSEKIPGLVLQAKIRGIDLDERTSVVTAGAGENWHALVVWCIEKKLYGLENLALIPGTVGGAPIQNIGAYGVELNDVFYSLTAIEKATGEIKVFNRKECEFHYRDSIFKHRCRDQYVVVSVSLQLSRDGKVNISYPELKKYFSESDINCVTHEQVFNAVVAVRKAKLPDPAQSPNAGSFFKNPVITPEQHLILKRRYPDLVAYPQSATEIKLAAAWLIDSLGWKGRERHGLFVHQNQALVLTNPNRMGASHILKVASEIQADVLRKYDIQLEIEPQII